MAVSLTHSETDHFEGSTFAAEKIPWLRHLWRAETCMKFTNAWCVYFGACNLGNIN
jgi:hypothetical protein